MMRIPMTTLALAAMTLPTALHAKEARPPIEHGPAIMVDGKPLPFAEAVRAGDMLYLSGQVGMGEDGKLPEGMEAQARVALDGIGATLKAHGLAWKDVTRCLVMLSDMKQWPAFNTVYARYVDPQNLPARSAFGAAGLALGALVEVQCDAYDPVR